MENQLFNLKFTAKQLNRMSKKAEKEEKAERSKVKKAIEKGNMEGARIYAQNAIRQKNQSMNYLRLSSRVDAVASRVESAVKMQMVTKQMAGVVKGMDASLQSMDVEKIAKVMDGFERSFEDVDVRSEYIEQAINSSTSAAMPEEEVESLLQQVADEHGLEFQSRMNQATPSTEVPAAQERVASLPEAEEDKLAERLRKLREQAV
mmetsp:Transcript_8119/g.20856  ORF Transcript_8119/g.20856 Transcript_8119/m.20856 type:complete len:205 (+) Transcript_8119:76-690(+)